MAHESKTVSMNLSGTTLQHIENIKAQTNEDNRTRIVAISVKLADLIISKIKTGSKVYIENAAGEKEVLHFFGI